MIDKVVMKFIKQLFGLSVLSSTFFLLIDPVYAVPIGLLAYGVAATEVPTLSGTMLIFMSVLMATLGFILIKQKNFKAQNKLVLYLIGVAVLIAGGGGIKLINNSYALIPISNFNMDNIVNPLDIEEPIKNIYTNTTGASVKIMDIDLKGHECFKNGLANEQFPTGDEGECAIGLTVPNGESCFINCFIPAI
ncbi:MAG: midcut-by-XrtH protein [Pseudomonadota bacterium]